MAVGKGCVNEVCMEVTGCGSWCIVGAGVFGCDEWVSELVLDKRHMYGKNRLIFTVSMRAFSKFFLSFFEKHFLCVRGVCEGVGV